MDVKARICLRPFYLLGECVYLALYHVPIRVYVVYRIRTVREIIFEIQYPVYGAGSIVWILYLYLWRGIKYPVYYFSRDFVQGAVFIVWVLDVRTFHSHPSISKYSHITYPLPLLLVWRDLRFCLMTTVLPLS